MFPRAQDQEAATQVVKDAYIVFPHLAPFADPTKLTPSEASDSLYRTPLYLLLSQGPPARFALRLRYDAAGGGDRSTLNLNALQVREESEQLYVGGRKLERGVDYTISYDLGQVTFLNPDVLFGQGSAQVRVQFEERGIFAVAPTSILGMSTPLFAGGTRGDQRDRNVSAGAECLLPPAARLRGQRQSHRWRQHRAALQADRDQPVPQRPHLEPGHGPVAARRQRRVRLFPAGPEPLGRGVLGGVRVGRGAAGVDAGDAVGVRKRAAELGRGWRDIGFGTGFLPEDAVAFTWQNFVPRAPGDPNPIELRAQDIDTLIRVAGSGEETEAVLYHDPPCRHRRRHRAAEQSFPLVPAAAGLRADGGGRS